MELNANVLHHEINDELVLLDATTGNYFTLNEVGAFIWKGLSAGTSPARILEQMQDRYDGDDSRIRQDFDEMIGNLRKEGLIVDG